MPTLHINSQPSLSNAIGELRALWDEHKFLRVSIKTGRDRSAELNALSHVWYEQVARETRDDDALGVKAYCKLVHGIPILRADDDEFRSIYDAGLKHLSYEQKLVAMKWLPVTSEMTVKQMLRYLDAVREDFRSPERPAPVFLEFPDDERRKAA